MLRSSLFKPLLYTRRFNSSLKDARNARKSKFDQTAAAYTKQNKSPVVKIGVLTVLGITGYAIYDINSNPAGSFGSMYYGSPLNEFLKSIMNKTNQIFEPASEKLLPDWPDDPCYGNPPPGTPAPPLLVVDLERTLIGSIHDPHYGWRHVKRPGVDQFIKTLSNYYEVVIFSENDIGMAQDILLAIDKENRCHKLGASAGEMRGTQVLKRLDLMNRDLGRIILIDDDPESFQLFPKNTLHVKPFTDINDKTDTTLLDLIPLLQAFVHEGVGDFRQAIDKLGTHDADEAVTEYRMRLAAKKREEDMKRNRGIGALIRGPIADVVDDGFVRSSLPTPSQLVGGSPDIQLPNNSDKPQVRFDKDGKPIQARREGEKKKGKLFNWLDEAEKNKEEEERIRREKMNELYEQKLRAKAEEEEKKKRKMYEDDF
jgi:mitochondrial import inner membrane translocase subunit TIM50